LQLVNDVKTVKAKVFGPEPPCYRCQAVKKNVEKVAEKLKTEGINVQIERANIASKDTVKKYGVLFSPALAVNDAVKVMGRIPTEEEIERLIRAAE